MVFECNAVSTSDPDNSTSSIKTFGEPTWNAARTEVRARVAASSVKPIRSRPERPCATSCTPRIAILDLIEDLARLGQELGPRRCKPGKTVSLSRKQADAHLLF
jgi:hypothetical protein